MHNQKQQNNPYSTLARALMLFATASHLKSGAAPLFYKQLAPQIIFDHLYETMKDELTPDLCYKILQFSLFQQRIRLVVARFAFPALCNFYEFYHALLKDELSKRRIATLMLTNITSYTNGVLSLDLVNQTEKEWRNAVNKVP